MMTKDDVSRYVDMLEKKIVALSKEVEDLSVENTDLKKKIGVIEHNRKLSIMWANGGIENQNDRY